MFMESCLPAHPISHLLPLAPLCSFHWPDPTNPCSSLQEERLAWHEGLGHVSGTYHVSVLPSRTLRSNKYLKSLQNVFPKFCTLLWIGYHNSLWICICSYGLYKQSNWWRLMACFSWNVKWRAKWCHVQALVSYSNPLLAVWSGRALQRQLASKTNCEAQRLHKSHSWYLGSHEHVSWYQARLEEGFQVVRIRETYRVAGRYRGPCGQVPEDWLEPKFFQLLGNECHSCKA